MLTCTAGQVGNDLDTLRRNAMNRLNKDENDAATRIQQEFDTKLADVTTQANSGYVTLNNALTAANSQARLQAGTEASQMLANLQEDLGYLDGITAELQSPAACFIAALPNPVPTAYNDVTRWGARQQDAVN